MSARETHDKTMVTCHECGKAIPSIPSWLATVKVKFECEECRQKAAGRPVGALAEVTGIEEPEDLGPDLEEFDEELTEVGEGDIEPEEMELEEPLVDDEIEPDLEPAD